MYVKDFRGVCVAIDEKGVNGSFEAMCRKFKRKVIRERIIFNYKQRQEYKKPSQKRHYRDFVVRCKIKYAKKDIEKDTE